jgi:glycosyltransferase involved in cell wall biosynthesis
LAFSEEIRARRRLQLGLEGKLVFAYAGTIAPYQHIEDGLLPFFRAAVNVSPTAHLVCLTNEVGKMNALIRSASIPESRVTLLKVPQRDVAEYLCAADAGILLRAPTRLTRLSLPVKFAEYLASGLPVVVSRIGEWLEERVSRRGIGTTVECFGVSEERLRSEANRVCELLERHGAAMRRAALQLCEQQFLWARYVPAVRNAYRTALERIS